MAVNDFTGQNIQDTYQKVVQTDGTNLADGTGSLLPISFRNNDVIISGSLIAQTYVVSESIVNISSGSTVFGDSLDDTHFFSGSITASGVNFNDGTDTAIVIEPRLFHFNPDSNNNGVRFKVDDVNMETRLSGLTKLELFSSTIKLGQSATQHITASGNISSSGEIIGSKGTFRSSLPLVANTTGHQAFIINSDGNANNNPYMEFQQDGTRRAFIQFHDTNNTLKLTSEFGNLELRAASTAGSDSDTTYLTVKAGGTISASADLTVGGHITASGNISSSGEIIALTGSFQLINGGTF